MNIQTQDQLSIDFSGLNEDISAIIRLRGETLKNGMIATKFIDNIFTYVLQKYRSGNTLKLLLLHQMDPMIKLMTDKPRLMYPVGVYRGEKEEIHGEWKTEIDEWQKKKTC